jgi:alanyl-tRNA synthetase
MTGNEIRTRFLEHFRSREHLVIPSAPLVPQRDPTTLFISAGMHPLKPYFQGVSQPPAPRLASCQKCFRTPDLEEVGRTDRHDTFFEMLGNFTPTGDYFKEMAIPLAWDLVINRFEIPQDKIRVTVHPTDDEARRLWTDTTPIRADWVYDNDDNYWYAGDTGPCGPDSELWFDRGPEVGCGREDCYPDHCERFLEFWNLVFMTFDRQPDGSMPRLPKPAIDTGMGLERTASILQGVESIFETDLFKPIVDFVNEAAETPNTESVRVVSDHVRAMTFVIGDGVLPSNEGRGYVLRRLMRRAVLHARRLKLRRPLADGVGVVVELMQGQYPELPSRQKHIQEVVTGEVERTSRAFEQGTDLFERIAAGTGSVIPGSEAFKLHDTFGFPIELTQELALERGKEVDMEGFTAAMSEQRARSRSMSGQRWPDVSALPTSTFTGYEELESQADVLALRRDGQSVDEAREGDEVEVFLDRTPFYGESGGQIGDTGEISGLDGSVRVEDAKHPAEGVTAHLGTVDVGTIRVGDKVTAKVDSERRRRIAQHHSATHLLHRALAELLQTEGPLQRGSWVGPDHSTFDFPLNRALTQEELLRLERRINEQARAALSFEAEEQPYSQAVKSGAMHLFEEKYGDVVRVVCTGDWTCEFCGGTHVRNSAETAPVIILSESSVGSGLRRLDFTAGAAALELIERRLGDLGELARTFGVTPDQVPERVADLRAQLRESQRRIEKLEDDVRVASVRGSRGVTVRNGRVDLITEKVEAGDLDQLRAYADRYLELIHRGVVAVTSGDNFVIKASKDAGVDVKEFTSLFGRGGGGPQLVQGKLTVPADEAFNKLEQALK